MNTFRINESLSDIEAGISNYDIFVNTIYKIREYFISHLGENVMNSIELYVDNATSHSGYAPVTMLIFDKYIIIKLSIYPEADAATIAYQFVHELVHFVFYAKHGINRKIDLHREETICSAASLIYIKHFYGEWFENCNNHVKNLENNDYRKGATLAEQLKYDFGELLKLV